MIVFNVFKIVQKLLNHGNHHIITLTRYSKDAWAQFGRRFSFVSFKGTNGCRAAIFIRGHSKSMSIFLNPLPSMLRFLIFFSNYLSLCHSLKKWQTMVWNKITNIFINIYINIYGYLGILHYIKRGRRRSEI